MGGEWEIAEAKKHVDILLLLAKQLVLDESLMNALSTACMKKPSIRGTFDAMVINQLEASLNGRVVELTATVSANAVASEDIAAVVATKQKLLDDANEDHNSAAAKLNAAQFAHQEAESVLKAAKEASATCLLEHEQLVEERNQKMSD